MSTLFIDSALCNDRVNATLGICSSDRRSTAARAGSFLRAPPARRDWRRLGLACDNEALTHGSAAPAGRAPPAPTGPAKGSPTAASPRPPRAAFVAARDRDLSAGGPWQRPAPTAARRGAAPGPQALGAVVGAGSSPAPRPAAANRRRGEARAGHSRPRSAGGHAAAPAGRAKRPTCFFSELAVPPRRHGTASPRRVPPASRSRSAVRETLTRGVSASVRSSSDGGRCRWVGAIPGPAPAGGPAGSASQRRRRG
jgi:hypothetical protein